MAKERPELVSTINVSECPALHARSRPTPAGPSICDDRGRQLVEIYEGERLGITYQRIVGSLNCTWTLRARRVINQRKVIRIRFVWKPLRIGPFGQVVHFVTTLKDPRVIVVVESHPLLSIRVVPINKYSFCRMLLGATKDIRLIILAIANDVRGKFVYFGEAILKAA